MHKGHPNDALLALAFGKRCHLALALRGAALQHRVSQADVMRRVTEIAGVPITDATVSRWFAGHYMPQEPTMMLALAKALHVDVGWLFFGDHSGAPAPSLELVEDNIATRRR